MGNCAQNAISSDPSLPSSSSPYISMHNTKRSAPHSKDSPFTPILPFPTQSNLGGQYILGAELGRGQFGIIRRCTSRSSGAPFACKSISKLRLSTALDVENVVREVRIMKHLSTRPTNSTNHIPGSIIRLQDVIEDGAFVHVIMELCGGGELFDRIGTKKCYPEAHAAFLMKSLLETIQFCHSMGIMHRDIKPENILLVEDSDISPIKLADFGLALEFSPGQKFSGMAGSTYYIAPEVLQGEYSEEIDIWSAGVVLYALLSGIPPFWGATEQRIFKAIQGGQLSFPPDRWNKISSSAKDMITRLLHPDAKLRLSPAQALNHPWILHHTKYAKHIQLNLTSSAKLPVQESAGNSDSHASTFPATHNQTLHFAGMSEATSKPELKKFFVDVIAGLDRNTVSISHSFAGRELQNGWTCTLLSLNGNEETLVLDVGLEKYLVSHDRRRKKIGWKLVNDEKSVLSISQPQ